MSRNGTVPRVVVTASLTAWVALVGSATCLLLPPVLAAEGFVYRRTDDVSAPDSQAADEARATLALVLYKQQRNLFDYRYLDEAELARLQKEAQVTIEEAAALTTRLKATTGLAPVDITLAEQFGRALKDTIDDAQAAGGTLAEPFGSLDSLSPQSIEALRDKLLGDTIAVRDVARANLAALQTVDNVARGIEREERLKREKELSALNRARLAWQTARSPEAANAARRDYDRQMGVVRASTEQFQQLQKSRLRAESAIRFFEQVEPAMSQFEAATTHLAAAHRMTQDLSGMDRADQMLEAVETLSAVADWGIQKMGRMNAEQLARDRDFLKVTILSPRFGTGSDSTYVNAVLGRMKYSEGDAKVLEQAWGWTHKTQAMASELRTRIRQARTIVKELDDWRSRYREREHEYGDIQTGETRQMVAAFDGVSRALLAVPDLLKKNFGLPDQHLACQALRYVGHTAGMLPTLVDRFSHHKSQRDQFVSLPLGWNLPAGADAPVLKARHMFLHQIGLAAYSDLDGGDQQTVFVPARGQAPRYVRLTRDEFKEVLRAMSVFTTLTGRNPTQDEFLRLCESRGQGPQTSGTQTFHYANPDPGAMEFFQVQERSLAVSELLRRKPDDVWPMPRYADVHVGRIVQIVTDWNEFAPPLQNPFDVVELLKIESSEFWGVNPAKPAEQLRFRTLSRRHEELVGLVRKAYGQGASLGLGQSQLMQAILLEPEGKSPLERHLRVRAAQGPPAGKYEVAVTATQPELRKLRIVVTSSAPRSTAPERIETNVEVLFPGRDAPKPVRLSPPENGDGKNVLFGEVEVPIAALAQDGRARCVATVRFDEVKQTAEEWLRLPTLLRPADPTVSPDVQSYVSYQFCTAVYHHPQFRLGSGSECEVVLVVRNPDGGERSLNGPFRYDRDLESLTVISTDVRVDDAERWPAGVYYCRYEFRFPGHLVNTDWVPFEVLPPRTDAPPAGDVAGDPSETRSDEMAVPDPTGPLRAAQARAMDLSGYLQTLASDVRTATAAVEKTAQQIAAQVGPLEAQADGLLARIDDLTSRQAEIAPLAAQISAAAEKAIEAQHAARRAADAACAAADRAAAAASREQWQQEIDAAKAHAAEARRHQKEVADHTAATLRLAARLRELDAAMDGLAKEIGNLQQQAAELQAALLGARETLAVATQAASDAAETAEQLRGVRQLADGLLAAGRAALAPFGENPQALQYGRQLQVLHGQITEASKPAESLPAAIDTLVGNAATAFNDAEGKLRPVVEKIAGLKTPANPHRNELLTALAQADVAEVWFGRGTIEIGRAAACSSRAEAVPAPREPDREVPLDDLARGVRKVPPADMPPDIDQLARGVRKVPPADTSPDIDQLARGVRKVPPATRPPGGDGGSGMDRARTVPPPDTPPADTKRTQPVKPRGVAADDAKPVYAVYAVHPYPSPPRDPQQFQPWMQRALDPRTFQPQAQPMGHIAFHVTGQVLDAYRQHEQRRQAGETKEPFQLFRPNARYHQMMDTAAGGGQRMRAPLLLSFVRLEREEPVWVRQTRIGIQPATALAGDIHPLGDSRTRGSWSAQLQGNPLAFGPLQYDGDDNWTLETRGHAVGFMKNLIRAIEGMFR
ncbi:MAG: hypothetical protein RBS80_26385 [Thermoguttaceae bacterium]|jgi:hypothetical protein|nr:hypothetical protein [Thermoguttaceae bacterium]